MTRNNYFLPSHRIRSALLEGAVVGRAGVNAFEKRHRSGMTLLQPAARSSRFQRKTHLDVGGGERIAGEPLAFSQFALPERHVLLELRIDQRGQRLIGDL